jgi:hypothetical protein
MWCPDTETGIGARLREGARLGDEEGGVQEAGEPVVSRDMPRRYSGASLSRMVSSSEASLSNVVRRW